MTASLTEELHQLVRRVPLTRTQMKAAVKEILSGNASDVSIAAFLTALAVRGETADELAGAVDAVQRETVRVELSGIDTIDLVGTGGDRLSTFNVSTAAAFVTAGAGMPVAKHGNRSASSQCGSADVLESLGISLDFAPEQVEQSIRETGIGFMYAPMFHRGMKHSGHVRKMLGVRTVFNLVGPLVNPAQTRFMLVGVYSPRLTELFADVLRRQGVTRAMVVCGSDGMDELTVTGTSRMTLLDHGNITTSTFFPELLLNDGLISPSELVGGSAQENADILLALLQGKIAGGKKAIVILNAGAALFVAGKADSMQHGVEMARDSLESGEALSTLRKLVEFSHDNEMVTA